MFPVLFIISRFATLFAGLSERLDGVTLALLVFLPGIAELALYLAIRRWLSPAIPPRFLAVAATLANAAYAFLIVTDLRVLAAFHRPLDLPLYREGTAAMPVGTMLGLFHWYDWSIIALSLVSILVRRPVSVPQMIPSKIALAMAAATCAVGAFTLPGAVPGYAAISPVLRIPAVAALHVAEKNTTTLVASKPAHFDPLPAGLPREMHIGRNADKNTPNILFVVLESTGARYVFDQSLTLAGKGVPMPFLQKLRGESLYLARHYATANSSPRALFSLFTGLYPEPSDEFFSLKRGLRIKTWNRFLAEHRGLVVTPCVTEWYFPNGLFRNNGLREIIGKSQLSFGESRTEPADARNEIQTADYFAARLKTLQEPFFSVYISFAPHYPYHDYGPEWRITPGRSRLDRYVDNLRLLDEQLKKFFSALQQRGSLNNTIVVLVGDHSEAFKQHPGNYIHSLHSYEENLAVPAMIWYPARLRPREINFPTSHVDLGPTLLDLLEIGHNPRDFQGVSVLRNYRRPHIFAYGNEGTITVYTNEFRKVQRLRDTSCRMFDLQTDAAEKQPLACDSGTDSLESATKYAAGQMVLLQQLQNKNP
ncbi:MAG TPA: sulfatase-like hydrolase/transferase [Turneriella sp.]|nr:sulfatase-like hydrolase/transferase [Turneriella sp.]